MLYKLCGVAEIHLHCTTSRCLCSINTYDEAVHDLFEIFILEQVVFSPLIFKLCSILSYARTHTSRHFKYNLSSQKNVILINYFQFEQCKLQGSFSLLFEQFSFCHTVSQVYNISVVIDKRYFPTGVLKCKSCCHFNFI